MRSCIGFQVESDHRWDISWDPTRDYSTQDPTRTLLGILPGTLLRILSRTTRYIPPGIILGMPPGIILGMPPGIILGIPYGIPFQNPDRYPGWDHTWDPDKIFTWVVITGHHVSSLAYQKAKLNADSLLLQIQYNSY